MVNKIKKVKQEKTLCEQCKCIKCVTKRKIQKEFYNILEKYRNKK
jgi:hypothetical protein